MATQTITRVTECGCCSCWHRVEYTGDCRNNDERFGSPEEAADALGEPVMEVTFEEGEDLLTGETLFAEWQNPYLFYPGASA